MTLRDIDCYVGRWTKPAQDRVQAVLHLQVLLPENFYVTATDGSSQILHGKITQRELGFQFISPSLCQSTDIGRKALQCDTAGCHCGNHEDTTPYSRVQVRSRSL
jgi:hypothetical protein